MTITCTDIAAATAALVGAPLDPAALTSAANGLAAAVAAARAAAVFSVREALHYGGLTAPEYFGALDRSAAVEAVAAGALEALTARASEVGLVGDGAAEHRDQVNSFGGGHPDEVVAEAWAAADAWVAAAGALRDARDKVAEVTPCGVAARMSTREDVAALAAVEEIFRRGGLVTVARAVSDTADALASVMVHGEVECAGLAPALDRLNLALRPLLDDPASGVAGEAAILASAIAADLRRGLC
jgi:hypothetical protein